MPHFPSEARQPSVKENSRLRTSFPRASVSAAAAAPPETLRSNKQPHKLQSLRTESRFLPADRDSAERLTAIASGMILPLTPERRQKKPSVVFSPFLPSLLSYVFFSSCIPFLFRYRTMSFPPCRYPANHTFYY